MKKIKLLLSAILIIASFVSCNEVPWDDIVSLKISPTLINKTPRIYPGGNAECSTINIPELVQTTGRNNYIPSTDGFENEWPSGLLVKVDNDKSVSFQIDGSINLGDGRYYKVGAVIVKGSNASNVYDYTDIGGATMDIGLVSPNNSSGDPAGLSNLTFCFVECDPEPLVIAIKSATTNSWIYSSGSYNYSSCPYYKIGINNITDTFSFAMHNSNLEDIGTVFVNSSVKEGVKSLIVTIDLNDGLLLDRSYVYVGPLSGLIIKVDSCPDWESWLVQDLPDANLHTFTLIY
jgi:hypothetical protein